MQLIILLLFAFFCAIAFMQHMKKERVNSGALDKLIRQVLSGYRDLREHSDEIGTNAYAIGYAKEKYKGGLQDDTEALAVYVLDEKGKQRDGAANLGMEVIESGGRHYYQFTYPLEEKLSGAEMTALLVRIKEKLEIKYPDDLVSAGDSYITVVVDGRNLLDLLGEGGTGAKRRKKRPHYGVRTDGDPAAKTQTAHGAGMPGSGKPVTAADRPGSEESATAAGKSGSEDSATAADRPGCEEPVRVADRPNSVQTDKKGSKTYMNRVNFGAKPLMFPQPVLIIGTYDENGVPNAMNAAWGITTDFSEISISLSEHKTTDNFAVRGAFTVSMATEDYVKACDYVGIESGRKVPDKFERAGFHAVKSEFVDAPLIAELPMALECKVKSFTDGILVGEIVNVCADESILTDGKIDVRKMRPISFDPMGNAYFGVGDKVGNAFKDGLELK